jgi:hypothetical protein
MVIRCLEVKFVVARNMNGNVPMVIASTRMKCMMEKLNALMDLMKATSNVVSKNSLSTTLRNVVVIQALNGLVEMDNVS